MVSMEEIFYWDFYGINQFRFLSKNQLALVRHVQNQRIIYALNTFLRKMCH